MGGLITRDFYKSGKDTIGQLRTGYTLKIIDENGNRCGIDMNGEFCIKPPFKMLGYRGREDLTKAAIDDEGFFRTGDLGHVDKDGDLFIVGRAKDMLRVKNGTISGSDMESFLITLPEIKAVCVVGIYLVDLVIEYPAAVVLHKDNSNITEIQISQMVAGK